MRKKLREISCCIYHHVFRYFYILENCIRISLGSHNKEDRWIVGYLRIDIGVCISIKDARLFHSRFFFPLIGHRERLSVIFYGSTCFICIDATTEKDSGERNSFYVLQKIFTLLIRACTRSIVKSYIASLPNFF